MVYQPILASFSLTVIPFVIERFRRLAAEKMTGKVNNDVYSEDKWYLGKFFELESESEKNIVVKCKLLKFDGILIIMQWTKLGKLLVKCQLITIMC